MRTATIALLLFLCFAARAEAQSWSVQTSGLDTNLRGVSAVYISNPNGVLTPIVWASGSNGVILRSIDAGKTWDRSDVEGGDSLDFRGIVAFDAKTAYVISIGNDGKSRVYDTIDGGATWTLRYRDSRAAFFLDAIACESRMRCVALGDPIDGKFLLLLTNDGKHWKELPPVTLPPALPQEGAFAASSSCLALHGDDIYFATGGPAARVFHSPDRGRTWAVAETTIASGNASSGIFSLAGEWPNNMLAVGGDYTQPKVPFRAAAYSRDRGKTWRLAEKMPGGFRSAVAAVDAATAVAVGPTGEDISHDGGVHWEPTDSLNLNAISILDMHSGWAVGAHGTIARFVNHTP
jgi:photosystem II stability/assembly factor-like uncharacterized protein